MILYILTVCVFVFTTNALDRKRLANLPNPDGNFDLVSWSRGKWYTQARYVPCSFSGSRAFSDIEVVGALDGNLVKQVVSWRDGVCTKATSLLDILDKGCGNFIQRDPIGGMMTGDQVVVVYNPKMGYDITWGCTKKSVDGYCSDPWLLVKTRKRFPGRYVYECIVRDLRNLYDLSLTEMEIVSHKRPC